MSLFDRALNAAGDAARSSAASFDRTQRRRAVDQQIMVQQQAIQWSTARIGRLARLAAAAGAPLPPAARAPADAAQQWAAELVQLQQQLAQVEQYLSGPPPDPRWAPPQS